MGRIRKPFETPVKKLSQEWSKPKAATGESNHSIGALFNAKSDKIVVMVAIPREQVERSGNPM
jgi:hypothetical protein